MSTIHDLGVSISQMNDEEAVFLIKRIRRARHIIPERRKPVVAAKRASATKANTRTINLFESMSSEARAELIKMLEEQG